MSDKQELTLDLALPAYFAASSVRTAQTETSSTLEVLDALRDDGGALRIGVLTYLADIAAGLASGLAVIDIDRWVVTTDLDVQVTDAIVEGPVRIDATISRAGATTVVAAVSVHDLDRDRVVGGGTGTFRPFPFEFDRSLLDTPIGTIRRHDVGVPIERTTLVKDFGFQLVEDGSATVDLDDWLRNPWGMLHGGVTACLVDVAACAAGSTALGRPARATRQMVRFLAPARVGPVRAVPRVVSVGEDGTVLVEVRVVDSGADDRTTALGNVTLV